ncbi:MAG: hypothetical protein BWX93_01934 [Bacteroidetes bacterium ADurb.Bin139]|nr:MAG: hypothetical protein BWX93_01934 [Bacteroidetes bacterium ADurb.Bin139]
METATATPGISLWNEAKRASILAVVSFSWALSDKLMNVSRSSSIFFMAVVLSNNGLCLDSVYPKVMKVSESRIFRIGKTLRPRNSEKQESGY